MQKANNAIILRNYIHTFSKFIKSTREIKQFEYLNEIIRSGGMEEGWTIFFSKALKVKIGGLLYRLCKF